jgi:hypothetical protein
MNCKECGTELTTSYVQASKSHNGETMKVLVSTLYTCSTCNWQDLTVEDSSVLIVNMPRIFLPQLYDISCYPKQELKNLFLEENRCSDTNFSNTAFVSWLFKHLGMVKDCRFEEILRMTISGEQSYLERKLLNTPVKL